MTPRPADVILVPALRKYRGHPSPVLRPASIMRSISTTPEAPILIHHRGRGRRSGLTEGGVGRAYLIAHDVPSEAIIVEPEGETTAHSSPRGEIMRAMG